MAKIKITNLSKSFNQQPILQGITLEAQKGDVIALLGSSGSGKSTLLRCINLLITPDQGELMIDSDQFQFESAAKKISSRKIALLRQKIGIVFQQFNLWSHMTVLQNLIEAPIHVQKRHYQDAVKDAYQLLAQVGLQKHMHHYPVQLSGGQQQRAAIARALMMKPDIMLFDEPTSALDPEMVNEVLSVMQELAKRGMTMIIATHELSFAQRVATRSAFLDQGKIIEEGETKNLFSEPKTERFRRFLTALQPL